MRIISRKLAAEFIGTFWLVFAGCGSAVFAAAVPDVGIGYAGVSLAFGLAVLTASYAFGPISGGHFNPAVTVGLVVAGRFGWADLPGYVLAQVLGACTGGAVLLQIAMGKAGFDFSVFATNGFGALSPNGFSMVAGAYAEVILSAVFLIVILACTAKAATSGFAGLSIGLCLTLIHLISIPVTNTSVNPARSTGVAIFGPSAALTQLWFFWVMPIAGAAIGALIYRVFLSSRDD